MRFGQCWDEFDVDWRRWRRRRLVQGSHLRYVRPDRQKCAGHYCLGKPVCRGGCRRSYDHSSRSEAIFFDLIEQGFITDTEILCSSAFVAGVRRQRSGNFLALNYSQRAMGDVREGAREIKIVKRLVVTD